MGRPKINDAHIVEFNEVTQKTKNQHTFINAVYDNDLVICNGPAGSGKTLCAIGIACKLLFEGKIQKILVARTVVACGKIGYLPGSEVQKVEPFLTGHLEYFQQILGKGYYKYIKEGKIVLRPLETLRGTTFHNSVMI